MEIIDLTSFEKALVSLFEVIKVYNSDKANLITRDSMIQRFEYTYLISLKMIKRYLAGEAFVFKRRAHLRFAHPTIFYKLFTPIRCKRKCRLCSSSSELPELLPF